MTTGGMEPESVGAAGNQEPEREMDSNSAAGGHRWYEKYLPFVAKSQEMQAEWVRVMLSRLRDSAGVDRTGVLSREEIKPYIRLLLDSSEVGPESPEPLDGGREELVALLARFGDDSLLLLVECADIYEVPKIIGLLRHCPIELAISALKKVPPPYEKNPPLVIDRVFQAIRQKSAALLEEAAEQILAGADTPVEFAANYERFREIMMDEHILSLLYPKAK